LKPQVPAGYALICIDEIDSTNLEALRQADNGIEGPLWIVAERQTCGRGRRGRDWITSKGNLFATLLLTGQGPAAVMSGLSFVAAVAVANMTEQLLAQAKSTVQVRLKWPNDVLLNNAKAGGILVETSGAGSQQDAYAVAIGIGLNVSTHPTQTLIYPTTDLAECGLELNSNDVFEQLAVSFDHCLSLWQHGAGFAPIKQRWLEFGPSVGQELEINTGVDVITGAFMGLDQQGELILRLPDGSQQVIVAGDITAVAPEPLSPTQGTL